MTLVIYESAIRNLIANVGDISITTVTARDIDQFKTARLAQVSPVSVNIELRTIKAASNIALRWELITSNPFPLPPPHVRLVARAGRRLALPSRPAAWPHGYQDDRDFAHLQPETMHDVVDRLKT